jgi:hypothetical protein
MNRVQKPLTGSRVKMFGKKEIVTSVRDTSEKNWETNQSICPR